MQIDETFIQELADQHNGTVTIPSPGFPNTHIKLPNGATVSIGYGPGHYCSVRQTAYSLNIMGPGLPMKEVEVAYWHPQVRSRVRDWDSDDIDATVSGNPGDLLPDDDVHPFCDRVVLRGLVAQAAALVPDWDLVER